MGENHKESKNRFLVFRYFGIIFLAVSSVVAGFFAGFYHDEKKDFLSRLKLEERVNVQLEVAIIESSLKEIISDLKFLSMQNELFQILNLVTVDPKLMDLMAREYLMFSRHKRKYDQIRFIDASGMEKVRVNFNNGTPDIVHKHKLQMKGDRYYFKDTMALSPGEIFISPFDLNIERGEIEKPLKPMIRFGIPVADTKGRKQGTLILNYLGNILLSRSRAYAKMSTGDFMLLNSDGYWISGPNADDEWGFMFKEKKNRKFSADFPNVWKKILETPEAQIETQKGLFTSGTIYPVMEDDNSSSGSAEARGESGKRFKGNSYYWKAVSHVPDEALHASSRHLLNTVGVRFLALIVMVGVFSWIIAQSLAKRKAYRLALYHSANFDGLTDLPNRALFMDRLEQILKQSARYQRKFALLAIDLDGFKSVNDTLGHHAGDAVLIQTAERLTRCVRSADTVGRVGGDEFLVILGTVLSVDDAKTVAEKIIVILSMPFRIGHQEAQIGGSIGISVFPEHGKDAETLIKNADEAMYAAKKTGKNRYRTFGDGHENNRRPPGKRGSD